jgi:hypothetical protein
MTMISLPLNLSGNVSLSFKADLSRIRVIAKRAAVAREVVPLARVLVRPP